MDFSELMSQGKVTVPVGIQKKLNLKEGDKVVFSEKENCIAIEKGVNNSPKQEQITLADKAKPLDLRTDEDLAKPAKEMKMEQFDEIEEQHSEKNFQYINEILEKLNAKPVYPVKNRSITVSAGNVRPVRVIRLTRPQFSEIAKHAVMVEMNDFNWEMSLYRSQSDLLFSKMFVTLESLFGSTDEQGIDDGYKRSFYFPFLLKFPDEKENLGYLMIVHDHRCGINYKFAKILPLSEHLDQSKCYQPFEDFTKEEIKYTVKFFCSYLESWFDAYLADCYDSFFYKTIPSDLGVYGYKEGEFFDNGFDDPDAYDEFIRDLSDMKNSQDNKR